MARYLVFALILVSMVVGCRGSQSGSRKLSSLTISPSSVSVTPGSTTRLMAIGHYSDGSVVDLSAESVWGSSNPAVATVGNLPGSPGLVTGVSFGSANVGASFGGLSASATVSSEPLQSLTISPAAVSVASGTSAQPGTTAQLRAIGHFADGTQVDLTGSAQWSSNLPGVASVANAPATAGIVTGVSAGSAAVSASFGGVSGTAEITSSPVQSISVTPGTAQGVVGTTQQFRATGTLANNASVDLTNLASWSSSGTVASIAPTGVATSLANGTATVTASFAGVSGTASLNVVSVVSITITPASKALLVGQSTQLQATGTLSDATQRDLTGVVNWSSSAPAVASVSASGRVTALAPGSAAIQASFGSVTAASVTVTVQGPASISIIPANPIVGIGGTLQLSALDNLSQGVTNSVQWSSSNSAVASVGNASGNKGLITGNAIGSAVITATSGSIFATTTVTVQQSGPSNPNNRAFVTNFGSSSVSVIDTGSETMLATIPVGNGPQGIALNAATGRLYVANSGSGTLSVLTTQGSTVLTVPVGAGPWGVAVNPATGRVYVTNSFARTVSVLDAAFNTVVGTIAVGSAPKGVAVDPDSNLLYVANSGDNTVSVVDTLTNTELGTVLVGPSPEQLALDSNNGRLFVANRFGTTVSVLRTANNTVFDIPVVGNPRNVAVDPFSGRLYVTTTSGAGTLVTIDPSSRATLSTLLLGNSAQGLAIKPSTGRVYVVKNGIGTLTVIDASRNTIVKNIAVGTDPREVVVIP